jgi:hypothetical protein
MVLQEVEELETKTRLVPPVSPQFPGKAKPVTVEMLVQAAL